MTHVKFSLIIILLAGLQAFAQSPDLINLQWKVNPKDTIAYRTTMRSTVEKSAGQDETGNSKINDDFKKFAAAMAKANSDKSFKTVLYQNRSNSGYIDIAMIELGHTAAENAEVKEIFSQKQEVVKEDNKDKKKTKKNSSPDVPDPSMINKAMHNLSALNDNIVLRGRISRGGEIISTYYKNSQTNMIALMFELPNRPVKIGEPWNLNVNLIEMDQNFEADMYTKENKAYIEKVEVEDGKQVAVIKYMAKERVEGDFNNPMAGLFGGESKDGKTIMEVTHTGTGRFSISAGKWLSYKSVMTVENSMSVVGGKGVTVLELEPINK